MRCMKALVILAALAAFPMAAQETVGPSPTLPSPNATPSAVNFAEPRPNKPLEFASLSIQSMLRTAPR
jgi:hypothetical protein